MTRPTAIDVFGGCGGSGIGFRRVGFDILAAIENDPYAAESYERNIGVEPIVRDVCDVTGRELLKETGIARGELTALIGCPPCQGFTSHRRDMTRGRDPRNVLLGEYVRLVRALRPQFVVFENVPGLAKGPSRWRFEIAVRELRALGYELTYEVVQSADYGVPQFRKRLLVIGASEYVPVLPEPTHGDPENKSVRRGERKRWMTVRDAIGDLRRLRSGEADPEDALHVARKHSDLNLRRLKEIPHDGGSRDSLPAELVLACHKDHEGHYDVYGRMWWDRPAPTLTSGCTNITRGRFAHPVHDRAITLREALLLQGFPKYAWVAGGVEEQSLQVGNAVPPALGAAAARAVRAALRTEVRAKAAA